MKFPENYDQIIDRIEELAEDSSGDILRVLVQEAGCNGRLLGDAFQFITGITLAQYVRRRRLVHAVNYRLRSGASLEETADRFGFSDAAAMSRSFKKTYGMSPSCMTEEELAQYPPLHMENLLSERRVVCMDQKIASDTHLVKDCFGVTDSQFQTIRQVMELNAVYGMDDESLKLISWLMDHCQADLNLVFSFVEDLNLQIENGDLYLLDRLPELAQLCFQYSVSCTQAEIILEQLNRSGIASLKDLPEGFFTVYFSRYNDGYSVSLILEILQLLAEQNRSPQEFDRLMEYSEYYRGDPIASVLEHDSDEKQEWASIRQAMNHPEEVHPGKREPDIWELSEEEYYRH